MVGITWFLGGYKFLEKGIRVFKAYVGIGFCGVRRVWVKRL